MFTLIIANGARGPESDDYYTKPMLGYSCVMLMFGSFLLLCLVAGPASLLGRCMSHPILRFFGRYSYALYMVHNPLRAMLRELVFNPWAHPIWGYCFPAQIAFYFLATGLAVAVALLSWNLFEKHFLKLKAFFRGVKLEDKAAVAQAEAAEVLSTKP
jgi:peptidoglycan/LPS O-acetylase OafA/YrhL